MLIDKTLVKRILVITLSNVGDIILTTPVIRALAQEYPSSRIDVMVGPNGKDIFDKDPRIFKLIIYDKHMPIVQKRRLQLKLKKLKYDLVIDLRNTIFPLLIGPRYRTATIEHFPQEMVHKKQRHLYRLGAFGIERQDEPSYVYIPEEDDAYARRLLQERGVREPMVVVNPGAKSHLKRWTVEGFSEVCDHLNIECGLDVVFTGLAEDLEVIEAVSRKMRRPHHMLTSLTNIRQLAALMKRAKLILTNDSAPLHIGCAAGVKVLALFGPTDPKKYGPTGEFDMVISKPLSCAPCESATCAHNLECMKLITPQEVFEAAKMMVEGYG